MRRPWEFLRYAMLALISLALLALYPIASADGPKTIRPHEVHDLARKGELILVDIRSPGEWRQSGVADPAVPITIHGAGGLAQFERDLATVVERRGGKPIALICATGLRSGRVQAWLKQRGHTDVLDVAGGMFGSGRGRGWLADGMPVEPCRVC